MSENIPPSNWLPSNARPPREQNSDKPDGQKVWSTKSKWIGAGVGLVIGLIIISLLQAGADSGHKVEAQLASPPATSLSDSAPSTSDSGTISSESSGGSQPGPSVQGTETDASSAWVACERYAETLFPNGVKLHSILGLLAEQYESSRSEWFLKAKADITDGDGVLHEDAVVECFVSTQGGHLSVVGFDAY